jgi:gamma-tubulin complex component 2
MDIAKTELQKPVHEMQKRKLDSLLELAVRSSTAKHDPHKDDLSCFLQRYTLMQKLDAIHSTSDKNPTKWRPDPRTASNPPPAPATALTGLDAFTLKYKVRWPLSLIISLKSLTKYQLIFRHLFYCKHVEAQLCKAWRNQQSLKELDVRKAFQKSYVVRQKMLHFLQNFIYYMMVEVLEPNWHTMSSRLKEAKSVDEVLYIHDSFLDNCLTQCLLNNQQLFKILTKLMSTCLLFSEQIKRTTQYIQDNIAKNLENLKESKRNPNFRLHRITTESKHAQHAMKNIKYNEAILSLEEKFTVNVGQFIKILRSKSNTHYEHHLTNLSTRLDYNGFYTKAFPESYASPAGSPVGKAGSPRQSY